VSWGLAEAQLGWCSTSAKVIKRILLSPQVPKKVRLKVEQYVEDKIRGRYGHSKQRTQRFGDQFHMGYRDLKPKH